MSLSQKFAVALLPLSLAIASDADAARHRMCDYLSNDAHDVCENDGSMLHSAATAVDAVVQNPGKTTLGLAAGALAVSRLRRRQPN